MLDLFNLDASGNIKISINKNIFNKFRRTDAWYTKTKFAIPTLFILAGIDISGFCQIALEDMGTDTFMAIVTIMAFSVAFELAPIYVGYAICLIKYNFGSPIRKVVFGLSLASFIIGILANFILRFLTLEEITFSNIAVQLTMCLLPIITSLVNLVIGCLSFNPLLFDIKRVSKDIRILTIRKCKIEAALDELSDDSSTKDILLNEEEIYYDSAHREIMAVQLRLKNYIYAKSTAEFLK